MTTATNTPFLALDYTDHHYGQPVEAQSEIISHQWNVRDCVDYSMELTIEPSREETINDYDTFHVWIKAMHRSLYCNPDNYVCVTWWKSPKFTRFEDAEAFAQFAYQRWQATGTVSASGMDLRDDLDANRNPVCDQF